MGMGSVTFELDENLSTWNKIGLERRAYVWQ